MTVGFTYTSHMCWHSACAGSPRYGERSLGVSLDGVEPVSPWSFLFLSLRAQP